MVNIERATIEDVPEIKRVLSETWKATYGPWLSEETITTVTSVWHNPDQLALEIQNPNIFFGVARLPDGPIAGITTLGKHTDDTIMLFRLYIHPQYQRRGLGSNLLDAGIAAFPAARMILLEVEENNQQAYAFYLRHGFQDMERKEERVHSDVIKVIVMAKHLSQN